ncbi:MAG: S58 family peptidase [Gemmatimonadales bacterium]|nr:S58 family peptidase [Gemmatimonadales bacterium]
MRRVLCFLSLALLAQGVLAVPASGQDNPRARDLGIPLEGTPGPLNAITDVAGVRVGHTTIIRGDGPRVVGKGPVRTGVTAILPRGDDLSDPVFAAWFTMNGNGEMTGTTWVEESGFLEGPVMITNTHSVGVVRDAVIDWMVQRKRQFAWALPVVAETYDGWLNDINGFHVTAEHAFTALDGATGGAVVEGNVGGGTGMICHGFKGGIGTASRRLEIGQQAYTVGVLVQCNYGSRSLLRIAGVPVGQEIPDLLPCYVHAPADRPSVRLCDSGRDRGLEDSIAPLGSIIIVAATDAPLLPHQLKRIVKRASFGVAKMGGIASNGSGDIFIAFSTANRGADRGAGIDTVTMIQNRQMNALFLATVQATEEAIINAMLAAETMTGADDRRVYALPHDRLRAALREYGRLAEGGER